MINTSFLLGCPVEFKQLCLVYPPSVRDVACNKKYGIYLKILTLSQEELEDEYTKNGQDFKDLPTPFEYLINSAYHSKQFKSLVDEAFYFFIHEPILILPDTKEIVLGELENLDKNTRLRVLTEDMFFDFQNLIREAVGSKPIEPPNPNENPRIKAIKAKARYRDRIKAKQGKGLNLSTIISSISCMNMGLNPLNIGELSYAAVLALLSTYQQKEKYELDINSLLAGADSKKVKPKYWIRNLEN